MPIIILLLAALGVLVDINRAAEHLSTSPRHLRRLVAERRIPFVRLGGRKVRFDTAELDRWVDAQRVPPVDDFHFPKGAA